MSRLHNHHRRRGVQHYYDTAYQLDQHDHRHAVADIDWHADVYDVGGVEHDRDNCCPYDDPARTTTATTTDDGDGGGPAAAAGHPIGDPP